MLSIRVSLKILIFRASHQIFGNDFGIVWYYYSFADLKWLSSSSSLFSAQNAHFKPVCTKLNTFEATVVLHRMIWNFGYELLWEIWVRLTLLSVILQGSRKKKEKFLNYFPPGCSNHLMWVLSIFPQWGTTTPKGFLKKRLEPDGMQNTFWEF